jgi:hypothetical protein
VQPQAYQIIMVRWPIIWYNELIHLQDIFSTEDITSWDAESISFANENFETYAGNGQILIPIPVCDFDYWENYW